MTRDRAPRLRITGRSSSHFTRVVRMVADDLALAPAFVVLDDLMSLEPAAYGGHPALKIPTLHVDEQPVYGADNICRRLAEVAGRADDPRVVLAHQVTADHARNAQELVWHAMAAQVQLVLGVQGPQLLVDSPYLAKIRRGLIGALAWLDAHVDAVVATMPAPRDLSVFEVTLFCLLEHLVFRPTVALDQQPQLRGFAAAFAGRASAQRTRYHLDPSAR